VPSCGILDIPCLPERCIPGYGCEDVHPVFLIDEAHLLHPEMLGQLHILLNY
jgi:hypothetical protein